MKDKKELIKQQLRAFSGWLRCSIDEYNFEDAIERDKNEAIRQAFAEAQTIFGMVRENIEALMDGGDDGERYGIDPHYL